MFLKLLKSKWALGAIFALFCILSPITLKASLPDFDGNGKVDFADFLLFVAVFGQSAIGQNAVYDLDGSGTVDFGDFLIFATAFGQPTSDTVRGVSTQGFATRTISNLLDCPGGRISSVGTITSDDGNVWIMPAQTQYTTARHASDMYNQCTGVFTSNSGALNLSVVPVVEIDQDGETITGYIFADNYFEFYVNGTLIAVDAVPFTPFNSSMVRFKVKRPFTIAIKLVDWEENLGLGTEANRNFSHHPGDGGLVASFHDANGNPVAITNDQWKAQTFYIAPIRDLSCIVEKGIEHLSGDCDTRGTNNGSQFYAMHYPVPSNWYDSDFDDSGWPQAYTYTNATVGVNNKPAYTNFTDLFDDPEHDAQFIWSSNLILDNEVLVRYTVK